MSPFEHYLRKYGIYQKSPRFDSQKQNARSPKIQSRFMFRLSPTFIIDYLFRLDIWGTQIPNMSILNKEGA